MSFLDDIKAELVEDGVVTEALFYYLDDRINAVVSDKLSQAMEDVRQQLEEDQVERFRKLRNSL